MKFKIHYSVNYGNTDTSVCTNRYFIVNEGSKDRCKLRESKLPKITYQLSSLLYRRLWKPNSNFCLK